MRDVENFVGVERVREFLAYRNPESVYRLAAKGLPCVRVNGHLRFKLSQVEQWVAEQDKVGHGGTVHPLERKSA